MGHILLGSEHILLGLFREDQGIAPRILLGFPAVPDKLRNEILAGGASDMPGVDDTAGGARAVVGLGIIAALLALLAVASVWSFVFVVLLLPDRPWASSSEPRRTERGELGFGTGLLFGGIIGVGVGYAIARQRQSSRKTP